MLSYAILVFSGGEKHFLFSPVVYLGMNYRHFVTGAQSFKMHSIPVCVHETTNAYTVYDESLGNTKVKDTGLS